MNLILQYYDEHNEIRRNEYIYCIRKNLDNPYITNVVLFADKTDTSIFESGKITTRINLDHRITYKDVFKYANMYLCDQLCILANLDIYFDETLSHLDRNIRNKLVALSRYNTQDGVPVLFNAPHSQDAWIFRPPVPDSIFSDFSIGHLGCDNRIAAEFYNAGWKLSNPARLIKCYHLHNSQVRHWGSMIPPPHRHIPITDHV